MRDEVLRGFDRHDNLTEGGDVTNRGDMDLLDIYNTPYYNGMVMI